MNFYSKEMLKIHCACLSKGGATQKISMAPSSPQNKGGLHECSRVSLHAVAVPIEELHAI